MVDIIGWAINIWSIFIVILLLIAINKIYSLEKEIQKLKGSGNDVEGRQSLKEGEKRVDVSPSVTR